MSATRPSRTYFQHGALKGEVAVFGGSGVDGAAELHLQRAGEDPARKEPIIFAIAYGPGRRTKTGAIQPASKQMARVSIFLDRLAARHQRNSTGTNA